MAAQTQRAHTRRVDERRKKPRYMVNEDVIIWDLHSMRAGFHTARIADISRNGMRLESADRLRQGRQVAVDYKGMIICGTVQHSVRMEHEFAMGVLIKDVFDPLGEELPGDATDHETRPKADPVLV